MSKGKKNFFQGNHVKLDNSDNRDRVSVGDFEAH